jgi:hypothetical protein
MTPPASQRFKRGDEVFTAALRCLYAVNVPAAASRTGQVYTLITRAVQ